MVTHVHEDGVDVVGAVVSLERRDVWPEVVSYGGRPDVKDVISCPLTLPPSHTPLQKQSSLFYTFTHVEL